MKSKGSKSLEEKSNQNSINKFCYFDSELNEFILDLYNKLNLQDLLIPEILKSEEVKLENIISKKYSEDSELYGVIEKFKQLYFKKGFLLLLSIKK